MKKITVNIDKAVVVFAQDLKVVNGDVKEGSYAVSMYRRKADFYNYAARLECFSGVVSTNVNGFIKKIKSLGFDIEVDTSWGNKWEAKFYASK